MEERKELRELLERMDESNRQQAKFAKLQCIFSAIAALCCVAVIVAVCLALPRAEAVVDQVDTILDNTEEVTRQLAEADLEGVITDLEAVSQQMAEADLAGLARDVGQLVSTSQTGVEEALETLSGIDLETLNRAIADLADVVEPLAAFFNRF